MHSLLSVKKINDLALHYIILMNSIYKSQFRDEIQCITITVTVIT